MNFFKIHFTISILSINLSSDRRFKKKKLRASQVSMLSFFDMNVIFFYKEILIHAERTIKLEYIQMNTKISDVIHNVFNDAYVKSTDTFWNNVCFYDLFKLFYPEIKGNL